MNDVHIVGIGAHTTVGRTMTTSAAAIGAGLSRLTVHPRVFDSRGEYVTVSMASYVADDLDIVDRMAKLALPAINEALGPLSFHETCQGSTIPLVLGLPRERPGLPNTFVRDITSKIVKHLGPTSTISRVRTILADHSAGLMAIEEAVEMIRGGEHAMCLAGGCDSYITPETLLWLDETGQLRSNDNITGFYPGEGAGFCLLASDEAWRDSSFARVISMATVVAQHDSSQSTPHPNEPSPAWQIVMEDLPDDGDVARVFCDLNGQRSRAEEFSASLRSNIEKFASDFLFTSAAMNWGDVGAASGPLLVGLSIAPEMSTRPRGPFGLVSTSTDNGPLSAMLLAVRPMARSTEEIPCH